MNRWKDGPKTYVNYGRGVPSKSLIQRDLMRLHMKIAKFAEKRASCPEDMRWAARVCGAVELALRVDGYPACEGHGP